MKTKFGNDNSELKAKSEKCGKVKSSDWKLLVLLFKCMLTFDAIVDAAVVDDAVVDDAVVVDVLWLMLVCLGCCWDSCTVAASVVLLLSASCW